MKGIHETHEGGVVSVEFSRGGWGAIPRRFADDRRLSLEALGLGAWFCTRPDGWQIVVSLLCKHHGLGKDRWLRIAKELESAGYLSRRNRNGERGRKVWRIIFDPDPQTTMVGKPDHGRTMVGSADHGSADPGQPDHLQQEHEMEGDEIEENTTTTKLESEGGSSVGGGEVVEADRNTPGEGSSSDSPDLMIEENIKHLAASILPLLTGVDQGITQTLVDELAGVMRRDSGVEIKSPVGWFKAVVAKARQGEFVPARALIVERARAARAHELEALRLRREEAAAAAAAPIVPLSPERRAALGLKPRPSSEG